MLVTFSKSEADSSVAAREYVKTWLLDEGFIGNGRFGCGMADWFVIGGRWSGYLSHHEGEERNQYDEDGAEDDAMVVTEQIYDEFLKEYEDNCQGEYYVSIEDEKLARHIIGKYWVVVTDYHS
jgi:hypothetical protein